MSIKNDSSLLGFWGERTATIDWCEANYELTHYIAEFWNTISNSVMIFFPLYGLYWSIKQRSNTKLTKQTKNFITPNSVIACHIGLLVVGIGSWLFHMTLLYGMQLLDEIPMIWGSGCMVYAFYDVLNKTRSKPLSSAYNNLALGIISLYCFLVTILYTFYFTNPVFHEIAYGITVAVIIIESITAIRRLRLSVRLYALSLFYYLFGFLLWNIDNKLCYYLKVYRGFIDAYVDLNSYSLANTILILLKSLSELHALWHLFTGYGSYLTILYLLEANFENNLMKNKVDKTKEKLKRPTVSKLFRFFYHLNRDYVNESIKEKV